MTCLEKGKYIATEAANDADLQAAQHLRARAFGLPCEIDRDPFDKISHHILVRGLADGALVCCFRLLPLEGASLNQSYAAQFYELDALERYEGLLLEVGRFCIAPGLKDPDILRVAWTFLTEFVDQRNIGLLFGCSSFAGVEAEAYLDTFAMLRAKHLAPKRWLPKVKAPNVFRFATRLRRKPDARKAMSRMPPLLRTYLMMGGWVSDHAVVDHQMNTLHVFTGLEVGAIPESRKRLLRAMV